MSKSAPNTELVGPDDILVDNSPRPTKTINNDAESSQTIIFEDHRGENYVWPFQLCRTYEAIKPLIEEAYVSHNDAHHLSEVRSGHYDIETDGAIILPSVWNFIVKPSKTIKISFRRDDVLRRSLLPDRTEEQWHHTPDVRFDDVRAPEYTQRPRKGVEEVTIDVDTQRIQVSESQASSQQEERLSVDQEMMSSEDDSDSFISSSDHDDDPAKDVGEQEIIIREVPPITDSDGNKISFTVDTSQLSQQLIAQGSDGRDRYDTTNPQEKERAVEGPFEKFRIMRAVMGETDGRTIIQIHTLPGPTNHKLHDGVQITWCHVHSPQLSLARFKDICMNLPSLSDRLKLLVREAFTRIERRKVKAFLDGFFIEPGTVLRTVEKNQPDPQAVIFSCVPYLELQQPLQSPSSKSGDLLFPPRTLMQAMYPYEPVRDRDSEQAYRKLGNDRGSDLVYVPNLWMLNIGNGLVVTCGHRPLADEMVKSIGVVQEDLSQLGSADIAQNCLTTIRLTDREGLVRVYSLEACRTYFQLETRLNTWEADDQDFLGSRTPGITWNSSAGRRLITANTWGTIINRTDLISIDLEIPKETLIASAMNEIEVNDSNTCGSVPPFFHWLSTVYHESSLANLGGKDEAPTEGRHEIACLEHAEKSMLNETLSRDSTTNAVDKTFASTTYYQSLPEDTHDHIRAGIQSSYPVDAQATHESYHAALVASQCVNIAAETDSFCQIVQATLSLFVSDTSNSSILRKVWGAMGNVHRWALKVQARGHVEVDVTEASVSGFRNRRPPNSGWYIRGGRKESLPVAEADKKLSRSIRHCRRCTSTAPFEDAEAAIAHLQGHLRSGSSRAKEPPEEHTSVPSKSDDEVRLNDWILQVQQFEREKLNAGGLKVLAQACADALDLFRRAKELADGVKNEDGNKSDLYTFPRELLEAFRKLIVFYLAVERALYQTEESYQNVGDAKDDEDEPPYSDDGLGVLKRFAQGAANSLVLARVELCSMVKPEISTDPMQDLALGPEYVCSWLMRRLMVKPLEKRMSVGDIYREYLSTIQFQVNHRPGKRLIRDLNLLQEELQVLVMINKWQLNMVRNYMRVLDDTTYEIDVPSRRAMFPFERMLLRSCLENLALAREEYDDLIRRYGPLSDQTKQSLEIYEEDHGKAITAFTVVTVIFLPLSFLTSYFGMNTVDVRDMTSGQSLFWAIALPLTFITIGATVLIGYNGDILRDIIASVYHSIIGKQDSSMSARGISVAQRKRAKQLQQNGNNSIDTSLADEAEYAKPQPICIREDRYDSGHVPYTYTEAVEPMAYNGRVDPYVPAPRTGFRTQRLSTAPAAPRIVYDDSARRYGARQVRRPTDYGFDNGHYMEQAGLETEIAQLRAERIDDARLGDAARRHRYRFNGVLQDEYSWHKKGRHGHEDEFIRRRRRRVH